MSRCWNHCFLEERPSVSLALFRFALAGTIGLHVVPTFLEMEDNYLSTAFRTYNGSFFPTGVLVWVAHNPDWLVWTMAAVFVAALACYFAGLLTRAGGVMLYLSANYFYARNALHIGTLSWDILLPVFFVMLCSPYPGDSFSVDSLLRGGGEPWRKRRPFFIQRLLQMMLASFYFYTALWKCWPPDGNWLTDHPFYYLMHSPDSGVIKQFPGRSLLAHHPALCTLVERIVLAFEFGAPALLFWRRTRSWAIGLGFLFHLLLVATMHVPTIFLFLFPPMLLLFIDPEKVVSWIERGQAAWAVWRGTERDPTEDPA